MDRLDMRVSDVERQAVADALREALGEGRLELSEYDERVQRAYQAKTYRDLRVLTADLPGAAPAVAEAQRLEPARTTPPGRSGPNPAAIVSVVGLFLGLGVLLSVASGGAVVPLWPLFIIGFWGLARRGRSGPWGRR